MLTILNQASVMGIPVCLAEDYAQWLKLRLQEQTGIHVVTLNTEMVMRAKEDPKLAKIIEKAELVLPDGSGVVLYCRLHGTIQKRYPGIELAESLLQQAGEMNPPASVFFYGGNPGIAEKAAQAWRDKYSQQSPDKATVSISTAHGYLSPTETEDLLQTLKEQQPNIIFVALGVPRQEFWIAKHRHLCPNSIWVGVGGSFDIWSGVKSRAPNWMCKYYLEWLYRLYQEPWRWRRMLILPRFALRALLGQ